MRAHSQVVALKTPERNGYWALVMGGGSAKVKHLHPAVAGQFLSRGLPLKRRLEEYMVRYTSTWY